MQTLPLLFFLLLINLCYRAISFIKFTSLYHDQLLWLNYVQSSLISDYIIALTIWLCCLFFALLFRNRFFRYVLWTMLLTVYMGFLTIALAYFNVFEAPFHPSMFGSSLGTFQDAMLTSAVAEFNLSAFINVWPFAIIFALVVLFIYMISFKPKSKFSIALKLFSFFMVSLMIFSLESVNSWQKKSNESNSKVSNQNGISFPIENLYVNPLGVILRAKIFGLSNKTKLPITPDTKFHFGLNTDSLLVNKLHPSLALARNKRYNIILYFFESTSYKYIGLKYKDKLVTPNWLRLMKNSLNFSKHYSHFPLSINTFFSVLNSAYEYPSKSFIPCANPNIKLDSIFDILHRHNYRTAIFHGSSLENFCRREYLKKRKVDVEVGFSDLDKKEFKPINKTWQADDRAMINPIVDFLKESLHPTFSVVLPISPHHPYDVSEDKFNITKDELNLTTNRKQRFWLKYINSLYFSDYVLGQFVARLEREGLMKNTLLFVFADHGEAFYQHRGNYLHSLFIYEENMHVPFMIYNKDIFKKPLEYHGISRAIDIVPTINDFIGINGNKKQEGTSLISAHKQKLAYLHTQWADDFIGLRDGDWKYIYRVKDKRQQLFNLSSDPDEKNNIVSSHKNLTNTFRNFVLKARKYKTQYFKHLNIKY